jgi:osmoprotectant transport system permease protein
LIEQRLHASGLSAGRREGLGSSVILQALAAGEIDVYVEYSGTIWANEIHADKVRPRDEVLSEVSDWLSSQRHITMLGELGFENAYVLAMSRKRAQAANIRTIADLARQAQGFSIAGDYEFFARPEWSAIRKAYGLAFRQQRQMQPEFMYQAVASGEADVISAYTSDGRIARYDLVALEDPEHAIPPYDAIVLLAPKRTDDRALIAALRPLLGAIDVDLMRQANLRATAGTPASPDAVARWLWQQIEQRRSAAK